MTKAIIIGAGPAGLATAAALQNKGFEVEILEKSPSVGSSWAKHYDCLRLHTSRKRSGLPGLPFPAAAGRYPSRDAVIGYLEAYATAHGLSPRFGCRVSRVDREEGHWRIAHAEGEEMADVVVVATGMNAAPNLPHWPGQDDFKGQIIHSGSYRNPDPFHGQRVLVVGFGNSGGDIARDLANAGVDVCLSQRGPVNILPKELFGIPITSFGALSKLLGYKAADALTAPILRAVVGRPEDYGLRATGKGPGARVIEDARIPLIDDGTLAAIKAGSIRVKPGITEVGRQKVHFADKSSAAFDHIIAATGYQVDLTPLLGENPALDATGRPIVSGAATGQTGLYFCSFRVSPDGQLFTIGKEALAIAQDAALAFSLAPAR